MQGIYGEESGNFLPVLIHILQQEPVGPDGQPGVDPLGPESALLRIQLFERLLYTLQAVLRDVRDGRSEVEDPAPAYRRGTLLRWGRVPPSAPRVSGLGAASAPARTDPSLRAVPDLPHFSGKESPVINQLDHTYTGCTHIFLINFHYSPLDDYCCNTQFR